MSVATYEEFGDDFRHDPQTAEDTLTAIAALCRQVHPDDHEKYVKAAKSYGLNGVDKPFWRDWPLSDPAHFLKIEIPTSNTGRLSIVC